MAFWMSWGCSGMISWHGYQRHAVGVAPGCSSGYFLLEYMFWNDTCLLQTENRYVTFVNGNQGTRRQESQGKKISVLGNGIFEVRALCSWLQRVSRTCVSMGCEGVPAVAGHAMVATVASAMATTGVSPPLMPFPSPPVPPLLRYLFNL